MGLGAFISPLVVEPFLLNQDCDLYLHFRNKNVSLPFVGLLPQCRGNAPYVRGGCKDEKSVRTRRVQDERDRTRRV